MLKFKFYLRKFWFYFLILIQFQFINPFKLQKNSLIHSQNGSNSQMINHKINNTNKTITKIIDMNIFENINSNDDTSHYFHSIFTTTTIVNSKMIQDELIISTWDYMTELILIVLLAILTIPSNIFLFLFYYKKVKEYKKVKNLSFTRYTSITNSFHTYLIEMCLFDTVIVIYLVLNTTFQFLFYLKKSQYESVFDISNFTCKFFIYILRISGAMSNYLVFLLSLNRCLLIFFKYDEPHNFDSHRLCLNTKYLTLFLFCICTIANVFRLELLNINSSTSQIQNAHLNNLYALIKESTQSSENTTININELSNIMQEKGSECGPNLGSIVYTIGDSTNGLFWSIIIYNLIFAIAPSVGNLVLSIYLIIKRGELKKKLDLLILHKLSQHFTTDSTGSNANQDNLDEIIQINNKRSCASISLPRTFQLFYENGERLNDYIKLLNMKNKIEEKKSQDKKKKKKQLKETTDKTKNELTLSEFHIEFLKTCSPCIAFSLTHVILFLPYSIIELFNQIKPYMSFMIILQYMTYVRYLFYCCKFYLLLLVSYKFRKEFKAFLNMDSYGTSEETVYRDDDSKFKNSSNEITCNKSFFYNKNRRLFVLNCFLCNKNDEKTTSTTNENNFIIYSNKAHKKSFMAMV